MRREKVITLDGKQITVRELKTADVIKLFETEDGNQMLIELIVGFPSAVKKIIPYAVDLPGEELEELTEGVNNYSLIEEAFKEVNSDFFACLPVKLETLTKGAENLTKKLGQFSKTPVGSSAKDT